MLAVRVMHAGHLLPPPLSLCLSLARARAKVFQRTQETQFYLTVYRNVRRGRRRGSGGARVHEPRAEARGGARGHERCGSFGHATAQAVNGKTPRPSGA